MVDEKVSTSTARIRVQPPKRPTPSPVVIALGAIVLLVIVVILTRSGGEPEPEPVRPPPPTRAQARPAPAGGAAAGAPGAAAGDPAAVPQFPGAFDTPTPEPEVESGQAAQQQPSQACLGFRWTTGLKAGVEEPVPIQVTITNGCAYDLDSVSLAFEASGYSGEDVVQTARGTFAESLAQGASANLTITLPANPGGFDRVDLQPAGG